MSNKYAFEIENSILIGFDCDYDQGCDKCGIGDCNILIPKGITGIGDWAFCGCDNLTSVIIPEGVIAIGDWAFCGCDKLARVTIPESVTSIREGAFHNCRSDLAFYAPAGSEGEKYAVEYAEKKRKENEPRIIVNDSILEWYRGLPEVIDVPEQVTAIDDTALSGCISLRKITLPKGLEHIGEEAFKGCSGLAEIIVPDGVLSIGAEAFFGCSSLKNVWIPDDVSVISRFTFMSCSALEKLRLPKHLDSLGAAAFFNCTELKEFVIPEGVGKIGKYAFACCSGLMHVVIPDGVTEISDGAFYGCSSLRSVVLPESLTTIGDEAFCGCSKLESVHIPKGVQLIGKNAFGGVHIEATIMRQRGSISIDGGDPGAVNLWAHSVTGTVDGKRAFLGNRANYYPDKHFVRIESWGPDGTEEKTISIPEWYQSKIPVILYMYSQNHGIPTFELKNL